MNTEYFEALLTTKEAAELLGVHTVTVRRWVSEGRLTPFRIGRNIRFRASELNEWIERG